MPTAPTSQTCETTNRIEQMLDLVKSPREEKLLPSQIQAYLREIKPTKAEAETASRIARSRENEAVNFTAKLFQKKEQLISAISSINYENNLDEAVNQKVELTSSLNVVDSLIEKDESTIKPTYRTDMIFSAIDAIKAHSEIAKKLDALNQAISNVENLWGELRALSFKAQSSPSEITGSFELHEYVQKKHKRPSK